jgi:hypothetical protein
VRQVGNTEQQIALSLFTGGGLPNEFGNFVANLSDFVFQFGRIMSTAPRAADLLAQAFAFGIKLLERGLHLAPLCIDPEQLVDPGFISTVTRREPVFHEIRLFANESNVQHAQEYQRSISLANANTPKMRDFIRCARNSCPWTSSNCSEWP